MSVISAKDFDFFALNINIMLDEIRDPGCRLFAAEMLLARVDALAGEREGVREARDIEFIHRMRVASRRLRAALRLFGKCLPAKKAAAWLPSIRRVTRALGEARDADVQIACVEEFAESCADHRCRPGARRLLLRLRQGRAALQDRVARALDRLEKDRLIEEMEEYLRNARAGALMRHVEPASPALFALAEEAITGRLTELLAYDLYVSQPERKEELHAMRIAAKRLRYTMELLAPLYPDELKAPVKTVKTLQEQLGDIHDCDVWLELLPRFIDEERARATAYFGHARAMPRLLPGLGALEDDRRRFRETRYQEFVKAWAETPEVWKELIKVVKKAAELDDEVSSDK